ERQPAGEQLEQDHAHAVQVAAPVHLLAADLFGRDVAGGADGKVRAGVGDPGAKLAPAGHQLGQPEIHHLDLFVRRVRVHDHQSGGLEVAVHNAALVRVLQGLAQLAEQAAATGRAEPAVAVQQYVEGDAADILHDDAQALRVRGGLVVAVQAGGVVQGD